jgi:hypothetical protein
MVRQWQSSFASVLVVILLTPQASEATINAWLARECTSIVKQEGIPFFKKAIKQVMKQLVDQERSAYLPRIFNNELSSTTHFFDSPPLLNYINSSFTKRAKPYISYFDRFAPSINTNTKIKFKYNTIKTSFDLRCNPSVQCIDFHDSIIKTEHSLSKEWNF